MTARGIPSGMEAVLAEFGPEPAEEPQFTTRIRCAEHFPVRDRALLAHATQIDPNAEFMLHDGAVEREVWPTEDDHLARSHVPVPLPEDDLFAGIRAERPTVLVSGGGMAGSTVAYYLGRTARPGLCDRKRSRLVTTAKPAPPFGEARRSVRAVNELSFRGKDRYRPSWPQFAMLGVLLAAQGAFVAYRLGAVGFYWLFGGTAALVGLGLAIVRRSWTTVGVAGISICWGIGRGRTYPWREIRWIDVRETKSQYGTALAARITLADGRRRSLPGLQHSNMYPAPDFDVEFRRLVNWWEMSTDEAARVQPPKQARDRLTPRAVGIILGFLISVVVAVVVVAVHR